MEEDDVLDYDEIKRKADVLKKVEKNMSALQGTEKAQQEEGQRLDEKMIALGTSRKTIEQDTADAEQKARDEFAVLNEAMKQAEGI